MLSSILLFAFSFPWPEDQLSILANSFYTVYNLCKDDIHVKFITCIRACILIVINVLLLWTLWTAVKWRVAVRSILSHLKLVRFWKYFPSNILQSVVKYFHCITLQHTHQYLQLVSTWEDLTWALEQGVKIKNPTSAVDFWLILS